MVVSIRELSLRDRAEIPGLLDVFRPGWDELVSDPRETLGTAFVADAHTFCFVAVDDERPVGWAWGSDLRRPDGRSMACLYEMDVVHGRRREGIGALLLEAVHAGARRRGCHKLWVVADGDDDRAQAFYAALGGQHEAGGSVVFHWEL